MTDKQTTSPRPRQASLPKFMGLAEVQRRLSEHPDASTEAEVSAMTELQAKLAELDETGGQVDTQRRRLRDIAPECFSEEDDEVTGVHPLPTKGA